MVLIIDETSLCYLCLKFSEETLIRFQVRNINRISLRNTNFLTNVMPELAGFLFTLN
jgi:hypothetical protein